MYLTNIFNHLQFIAIHSVYHEISSVSIPECNRFFIESRKLSRVDLKQSKPSLFMIDCYFINNRKGESIFWSESSWKIEIKA